MSQTTGETEASDSRGSGSGSGRKETRYEKNERRRRQQKGSSSGGEDSEQVDGRRVGRHETKKRGTDKPYHRWAAEVMPSAKGVLVVFFTPA